MREPGEGGKSWGNDGCVSLCEISIKQLKNFSLKLGMLKTETHQANQQACQQDQGVQPVFLLGKEQSILNSSGDY